MISEVEAGARALWINEISEPVERRRFPSNSQYSGRYFHLRYSLHIWFPGLSGFLYQSRTAHLLTPGGSIPHSFRQYTLWHCRCFPHTGRWKRYCSGVRYGCNALYGMLFYFLNRHNPVRQRWQRRPCCHIFHPNTWYWRRFPSNSQYSGRYFHLRYSLHIGEPNDYRKREGDFHWESDCVPCGSQLVRWIVRWCVWRRNFLCFPVVRLCGDMLLNIRTQFAHVAFASFSRRERNSLCWSSFCGDWQSDESLEPDYLSSTWVVMAAGECYASRQSNRAVSFYACSSIYVLDDVYAPNQTFM